MSEQRHPLHDHCADHECAICGDRMREEKMNDLTREGSTMPDGTYRVVDGKLYQILDAHDDRNLFIKEWKFGEQQVKWCDEHGCYGVLCFDRHQTKSTAPTLSEIEARHEERGRACWVERFVLEDDIPTGDTFVACRMGECRDGIHEPGCVIYDTAALIEMVRESHGERDKAVRYGADRAELRAENERLRGLVERATPHVEHAENCSAAAYGTTQAARTWLAAARIKTE